MSNSYTVAALADIMERRLQEIASQVNEGTRIISVVGQVSEIPSPKNNIIYNLKLIDSVSPTKNVSVEINVSTVRDVGLKIGDTITAYGSIIIRIFKSQAVLRLRVDRIDLSEPPKVREERAAHLPLLEVVRRVGGSHNPFPTSPNPTICLLCSATSLVREDFMRALGELRNTLKIRELEVSMANSSSIAIQIKNCAEDIMVLIRGGGDAADFTIFESAEVVEALGSCKSFRILGLGHSNHRTLADCVADHVSHVPAEAGRYLNERISRIQKRFDEKREFQNLVKTVEILRAAPKVIEVRKTPKNFIGLVLTFIAGVIAALLAAHFWTL